MGTTFRLLDRGNKCHHSPNESFISQLPGTTQLTGTDHNAVNNMNPICLKGGGGGEELFFLNLSLVSVKQNCFRFSLFISLLYLALCLDSAYIHSPTWHFSRL